MTPPPEPRTALDDLWRELEMDALASDGPIADRDVKDAISRWRPRIEAEAADAPLREALEQAVRAALAVVDRTTPLAVGEPLVQKCLAAALTARAAATEATR